MILTSLRYPHLVIGGERHLVNVETLKGETLTLNHLNHLKSVFSSEMR